MGLNAQNDFRKMNWGESSNILKDRYPEIEFLTETQNGMTTLVHDGYVSGLETKIAYCFIDNLLVAGIYQFTPDRSRVFSLDFIKDFNGISHTLNRKYDLERREVWHNDNEHLTEEYDTYLSMGKLALNEIGETSEGTLIVHSLSNTEGKISHLLMYSSQDLVEKMQESEEEDF